MGTKEMINIGIIGTGIGLQMHLPNFRRTGKANILAVVGSNQQRSQEFATRYGIPRALGDYRKLCEFPDIDLVCVTAPNLYHYEYVSYALKQDKHVLAEKPLALNMEEIVRLNATARASSKLALINHQLRFNPYVRKVRDLLQSGAIGRPYFIRIHKQSSSFTNRDQPWSWLFEEKMGGGIRLAVASHLIDLLWFWLGCRKVYHVKGAMDVVVPERRDAAGKVRNVHVCSFVSTHISMENNLEVHLSVTAAAHGEPRFEASVYGTEGELHFDLTNKLTGAFSDQHGLSKLISVTAVTPEELNNNIPFIRGSFVYFAPRIVDAILDGNQSLVADAAKFEEAIPTQQVLDAIMEAAITGEQVKLCSEGHQAEAHF